MQKISLWLTRIAPVVLLVLLFLPGVLSPFGYTDTFFGAPQSILSLSMQPDYIRSVCDPRRPGYDYIKSLYTNAEVAQTAVLSDIIPILCIAFFISYIAMAAGTIFTYFKKDTIQNTGCRIVKVAGFFSLGVTLATYMVNYSGIRNSCSVWSVCSGSCRLHHCPGSDPCWYRRFLHLQLLQYSDGSCCYEDPSERTSG